MCNNVLVCLYVIVCVIVCDYVWVHVVCRQVFLCVCRSIYSCLFIYLFSKMQSCSCLVIVVYLCSCVVVQFFSSIVVQLCSHVVVQLCSYQYKRRLKGITVIPRLRTHICLCANVTYFFFDHLFFHKKNKQTNSIFREIFQNLIT